MKKILGILLCSLTLCVSFGGFVFVNQETYASERDITASSELFIPSEISLEPLSYDSNVTYFDSALKLISDNKNESIRLKNKLSGEFTMEYLPEKYNNAFTAEKFTINFTDIKTQKSFSLNLEHGDTTNVYVQANGEKVGAYYLTGAFKGLTTLCNATGSYTEIVANKIAIKFVPETISLYAGAVGEKLSLVWSLIEEEIDGKNFGQIFVPFNEYLVDFSISQISSAKNVGEVLIYDINGCKFNNIIVDGVGNTSIYANFENNALVNKSYKLPAVMISDVVNGVKDDAQVKVTVVDSEGNNVSVINGSFIPTKSGDYTVNYEYNGINKKYVICAFDSQPLCDYEVFWNVADNYPLNSEIIIPEMTLTGGLLRHGFVKASVSVLKDGNVLAGYDKCESGNSFVFDKEGEYVFRYDIGAGAFVDYTVNVTEQKVQFVTGNLENYYEKGTYIDASDYKVLDEGKEVDFKFCVQYPDGKKYNNKKFALTEVGNYILSARYDDGQNVYNLTKKVVVSSKTSDFFSYTSTGVEVSHGRSLMTGRSGVKIHFEEADQVVKYNLPIDISAHKNIGQKNSYNVTKVSSTAKPIIELTIDPQKRGTNAASGINIYLTDAANPNNVVTVNVLNKSSSAWSYMRAAAPKQSLVGFFNDGTGTAFTYDNTTGTITGDGTMFYHAVKGGIVDGFTAQDSRIALYYDNETKQIFTHNARQAKTDIVVDLDDSKFTTAPWSGFESDTVYISFSLAYVASTGADATVYSIDGRSFDNENVSYSSNPQINIDESVVLKGIKGRDFLIPEATAYDCLGKPISNIVTKVYYDYSGELIDVSVVDGKFKTDKLGTYYIEYTAKDVFDNVSTKRVSVETVSSYSSIGISVDKSWGEDRQVATKIQICPINQVNVTNAIGVTKVTRTVYLMEGNKKIPVEISDDSLYTTKPGKYFVEFTVVDGTSRSKTGGYFITVVAESDFVIIGALPSFIGFVRGNSYEIPEVLLMDYSNGSAQEKVAEVYVNGELFNGNILSIERGEAEKKDAVEKEEYVTIDYKCGETVIKSYRVPVKTVYKLDVKKLPGGKEVSYTKFMQDRFFISENGATHQINSSGIILSSASNNGKISFVQPLASEKLNLIFDVNFEKTFEKDASGNLIFQNTNVKSFIITLTDAYDINKVLAIRVSTNDNTGYAYVYTNDAISQDISASLVGVSAEQFSLIYDNVNKKVIDVVTGTQILSPRTYENGEPFVGFSEKVYVSFAFECKDESKNAEMFLCSINGQSFSSSVNEDLGEPSITVDGKLNGVFSIGDRITVPSASAADVFGSVIGNGKFTVNVILSKGEQNSYVKDVNGLLLKEVSPYTSYELEFNDIGEYKIVYLAKDSNGVEKETMFTVTVVHDNKPTFTFDGSLPKQAKLNDKISIPKATANFFEKGNNDYSYVYVISPTYDMELVKANEFVAKEVGVYTIRYFALDVYGNYELVDFEIQVSK